jgi:hypothetical protein
MSQSEQMKKKKNSLRRFFKRGPWENFASIVIALGVFMLMQPFSKSAFGYSFTVLLTGLVCFTIVSHFPEE